MDGGVGMELRMRLAWRWRLMAWKATRWFDRRWYVYLFWPPYGPGEPAVPLWRIFWCRYKGHPAGPMYYNPHGLEPCMTCWDCGDFLT